MFSTSDTIVAVATPSGRGGIGVVRVSGPDAARIGGALIDREAPLEPRRATFTRILDPHAVETARPIDQVVVTLFAHPQSYTGEDVVEISAHGSPVLLQRIVELSMSHGARLAEPGEFTLRAYLNGRLDLVQAEAVADLVDAVTPLQARVAMDQLEGTLTGDIGRIDAALFDLSARLEASLDFPDEGFHFITRDQTRDQLGRIRDEVVALAGQGRAGRVVREGRLVVIVGRPNAGKSSLFNALVGSARAIVTEIPGTTRDVLTERVDIDGLAVTLVDTAGLRESRDVIEAEGVERARQAQQIAALSIVVLDVAATLDRSTSSRSPRGTSRGDFAQGKPLDFVEGNGPTIVVASKSDLPHQWSAADLGVTPEDVVEVSALTGAGLDRLRTRIAAVLCGQDDFRDPPHISNVRHLALLDEALHALDRGQQALADGATEELVLVDLGVARRALEEITGRRTPDDLLRHIFSRFCVGK